MVRGGVGVQWCVQWCGVERCVNMIGWLAGWFVQSNVAAAPAEHHRAVQVELRVDEPPAHARRLGRARAREPGVGPEEGWEAAIGAGDRGWELGIA